MSLPPLVFFSLTPEEDNDSYPPSQDYENNQDCTWIDDAECQENLFQIISLTPEEAIVDKDNHIQTSFKLFFEELGHLTEEPEPIDPNRDYDQEANDLFSRRDRKVRQKHVDHFGLPSLDSSRSGLSSASSSIYHEHQVIDVRSPHYLGQHHPYVNHHGNKESNASYHYGHHHHNHHHQQRPSRLH